MPSYQRKIPLPGKTADEIFSRISAAIGRFQEKDTGSYGKFDISQNAAEKTVSMKSTHASADLKCVDGEVILDGKLSFIALAFRKKIDDGIDAWIAKSFKA